MVNHVKLTYFGATDVGQLREHNEDSFVIIDLSEDEAYPMGVVLMVADGMGGANAGEVASAIACQVIEERVLKLKQTPASHRDIEKYLKNLILEAHHQIVQHAGEHPECAGMGTTAVIAWILEDHLHVVWCGDSRCYVYQKNQQYALIPFTDDHSLVWQMVQQGQLSAEEARVHDQSNIILQVLGSMDTPPSPSYKRKKLAQNEKVLLCSDGLNGMLSDADIQQILEQEGAVEKATETLIVAANHAGGTDNITVIAAETKISDSSTFPQKKNILRTIKSKWPFVLAFTLLSLILLFVIIAWSGNKAATAENEATIEDKVTSLPQEVDKEDKEPISPSETVLENPKPVPEKSKAAENAKPLPDEYNFRSELIRLNEQLEAQIARTKKLIEGCETCNDDPQLESVNESLTATYDFIKNQIISAESNLAVEDQSRQQLLAISQTVNVPYDAEKSFEAGSHAEQAYIIATLSEVISKISPQLESLTTQIQEKNK